MKRIDMIHDAITDIAHGDPRAVMGIIDTLMERGVLLKRIITIANRRFGIAPDVVYQTLDTVGAFEHFC